MFGFLKEKLKEAIGKITKKTDEEADVVEEVVVEKEVKKKEKKKEVKKEKPKPKEKVEEKKPEIKEVKPKEKPKKEEIKEISETKVSDDAQKTEQVSDKPKEKNKVEEKKEPEPKPEKKKPVEKKEVGENELLITYFVHSTTKDNEQDKFSGQNTVSISDLGIKQANELKLKLKNEFDEVFSSDLNRAVETVNIVWPDKKSIQDKRLRECDYGDLTGKTHKEIFSERSEKYNIKTRFPNGESYKDVENRLRDFLNELYNKYKGKHIAIVAHKYTQLAIEVLLNNKTWEQAIDEDWRKQKKWQPGWEYVMLKKLKTGFLSGIFKKKRESAKEEPKEEKVVEEVKEPIEEKVVEEEKEEVKEEPKEKKGFFQKITETVTKVSLSEKKFDEIFWELEVILLENNVALEVIEKIKNDLKKELVENKVSRKEIENKILDTLKTSISSLFDVPQIDILKEVKKKKPYIIMFVGVNGAGKTTTLAKFIHLLKKNNYSCVVGACDTFRAAAIQQLQEHTDKLQVKLIKHDYGSDPAAVAYDTIEHAKAKDIDVVLIDTAGRLHSNKNLMQELEKVNRIAQPDFKIFIGESLAGNDVVEQVRLFNEKIGIDGIILSKADTDEKGGAAISVSYVTGKPILYLGMGQTYKDLEKFDKNKIIDKLGL